MPVGLWTGLGAAIAWGLVDVTAALAGRRFGSLRVMASTQVVGAILLLGLVAVTTVGAAPGPPWDGPSVAVAVVAGLVGTVTYLAFFSALRTGPISVVSPFVSAYGGLTVVLAVLIWGEPMTPLQVVGAVSATVGVILVALRLDGGFRSIRVGGPGIVLALVALVGFAVMTIIQVDPIRNLGWLPALAVARSSGALLAVGLVIVAMLRPGRRPTVAIDATGPVPAGGGFGSALGLAIAAGLLDIAGLISFGYGLEVSLVWLVGLVSSFGPVVAVLVAVALLHERPRPVQWLGIVAIALGIVLIGLP